MKTQLRCRTAPLVLGMCLFTLPFSASAHQNTADTQMRVNAEIPDFIEIGGLPESVSLKVQDDGTLQSGLLPFYVVRNGANIENGKGFLLTVKSSEGNKSRQYYLTNDEAKRKLYVRVGFGDEKVGSIDRLERVRSSGIKGETFASLGSKETTHKLALFNNDAKYLYSRAPGTYSASFTVTVEAI